MGFVKIPVSFVGSVCDNCEFESSVTFEEADYCELFQQQKEDGKRCEGCLKFELRESEEGSGYWVHEH